jgi:beta-glucanase (GH16 family)
VATGDGGTAVADMSTGYHTYGVDWEADYITFYFDGQAVYKTATPSDMHGPMYMIANLAAGGYWPGDVTPGSVGQMNIDYIRAYASGAAAGAASTSTSSTTSSTTTSTGSQSATAPASTPSTSTSTSSSGGQTFTSDNNGDHWTGTAGNDTFNLGRGADVVTGNGGVDTFRFAEVPWAGGHITDFAGQDVLDLAFLKTYGYAGSDPIADGHVKLVSDGQGGTQVWADLDGLATGSGTWLVTTLDGISAANLSWQNGYLVDPPAGASTGSTSTSTSTSTASSGSGQTFTSDNSGDHWTGTSGNDVFNLGRGGDIVSGNGGNDTFKLAETPWTGGHITDFSAGDVFDVSAMLQRYGMDSSHLRMVSDGAGGTQVWFDTGSWGSWLLDTLDHVAPSSLSLANGVITEGGSSASTGGGSTSSSSSTTMTGQTFTSDNNGDHWTGTAGNDTFYVGRGGDVLTGAGGNDTFVFHETPWAGAHITDFSSGDTLDLSGMLAIDGYKSGDAVAEGYLNVTADTAGEAQIWSHLSGQWWLAATLDHEPASSLHVNGAFITG